MSVFGQPGGLFGNNNATTNTNAPGTTPGAGTSSNIFGSGSTFGAPKPGGGGSLFGAPTGGGAATGGSLFGSSAPQSAFGAPKPAEPSAAAPATSSAGFFSQPPASTSGATPSLFGLSKPPGGSATAPPTSLFGSAPAAPTTSAEPPKSNLFGGSNLFSKPAETSAPTPAASADASAPKPSLFGGGSLFGAKPAATTTASTSSSTTPAPAPASAANSFLKPGSLFGAAPASTSSGTTTAAPAAPTTSLFGAPKPAEKKDGAAAPAPTTSLFGAPASKPEEKKDGAATANASAFSLGAKPAEATTSSLAPTTVAVQPPSMLRGKSVEEIVNKWSSDLETHVRDFNKFAGEVAVWDRALIENGNNLSAILSHVVAAEREQNEVNQALDSIEQQQRDLIATLDNYEKVAQELAGGSGSVRVTDKGPADMERDKNYMLATDLQVHLDDLSGSLTQMIESVNSLTLPSENSSGQDPMAQISGILSSHLESLQWIDGAVREVESKVTEVERKVKETGHGSTLNASRPRGFGLR